jgi:hypothetical protein
VRRSLFRHVLLGACLTAPFLLAGCGGGEGVPQNYPPLRYTYLAPIALNVSSIQTEVAYAPSDDGTSLDAMSPEPPVQAVQQMLQDRLVASGAGGTATVTINTASINRVNDMAVGNISVQVAVTSADGRRTGYTQASVTRTRTLPDDTSDDALRAFLYQMTSDLVNAETVELEYQLRQHLAGWLVGGTSTVVGGPAAPAPVEAEPLSGPGALPVGAPVVGAPASGAPVPLGAPAPLAVPAPAAMPVPYSTPAAPSAMPPMPMPQTAQPTAPQGVDTTPTMPSGDLGLPQGNPVPLTPPAPAATPGAAPAPAPAYQLVPTQPPAMSAPGAAAPAASTAPTPAPAAPPPPANPGTLPPLPPTITP